MIPEEKEAASAETPGFSIAEAASAETQLRAELAEILDAEGITESDLSVSLAEAKEEYKGLLATGRQMTRPGKALASTIEHLETAANLVDQIKRQLTPGTSSCDSESDPDIEVDGQVNDVSPEAGENAARYAELSAELDKALIDEGISEAEIRPRLDQATRTLEGICADGRGKSSKARRLESEIEILARAKELADEIHRLAGRENPAPARTAEATPQRVSEIRITVPSQRFLSVFSVGDGSNHFLWRYAHPHDTWAGMQSSCHKIPEMDVVDSTGRTAAMQLFHADSASVENVVDLKADGLVVCFNPANPCSLDEARTTLQKVFGRPTARTSKTVLVGVAHSGSSDFAHNQALKLAAEHNIVYVPNVQPRETGARSIYTILQELCATLTSGEPCPPPYESSPAVSTRNSIKDGIARRLNLDETDVATTEPSVLASAPKTPTRNRDMATASPPYRQPTDSGVNGSVDLTDRSWYFAMQWPNCSVKTIMIMREWAFALKQGQGSTKIHCVVDSMTHVDEVTVAKAIDLLETAEGELRSEKRLTVVNEQHIVSLRQALMRQDFESAYDWAHKLAKETSLSFDLWRCSTLVESSCRQVASVAEKDIILQIGETGAGKSTTMHFFKSAQFVRGSNGGPVPDPNCPIAKHLEHIRVSTKTTSETATTTAVELKLSEVEDQDELLDPEKVVYLVDCPGLFDNRGLEYVVANDIAIVHTAKQAASVTVVFVHSQRNTGSRLEHIPLVISEFSRLIPSLAEHVGAVRWLWTGFRDDDMESTGFIAEMIKDLIKNPTEACEDHTVKLLIDKLRKQVSPRNPNRTNPGGARGVDLTKFLDCKATDLDNVRTELLAYILGIGMNNSDPIRSKTAFQFEASSQATVAIKEQIAIYADLIRSQLDQFPAPNAVDVVVFVLRELNRAASQIPIPMIRIGFEDCLQVVDLHLEKMCESVLGEFDRMCQPEEVMQQSAIDNFKQAVQIVKDAEHALAQFHDESTAFEKSQQLEQALQRGSLVVWNAVELDLADAHVDRRSLSKLCMLASVFEIECGETLTRARVYIEEKAHSEVVPEIESIMPRIVSGKPGLVRSPTRSQGQTDIRSEASCDFNSSDESTYDGSVYEGDGGGSLNPGCEVADTADSLCARIEYLLELSSALILLGHPPSNGSNSSGSGQLISHCREILEMQFDGIENRIIQNVEGPKMLVGSELKRCRRQVEFLRAIAARANTFKQITIDAHRPFHAVTQCIDNIVDGAKADIDAAFDQGKEEGRGFAPIEDKMARLEAICRKLGPAVVSQTGERWAILVASLTGYLNNVKRDLETDVDNYLKGDSVVDVSRLSHSLTALQSAKWMDAYSPGAVQEVVSMATARILRTLQLNAEDVKRGGGAVFYSDSGQEQLKAAMHMVEQLHLIRVLEGGIEGLEELRLSFEQWLSEKLKVGLTAVYVLFSDDFETLKTHQELLHKYEVAVAKYTDEATVEAEEILTGSDKLGPFKNAHQLEKRIRAAQNEAQELDSKLRPLQEREQKLKEDYAPLEKVHTDYYSLAQAGNAFGVLQKFLNNNGFKKGGLEKLDADAAANQREIKDVTERITTLTKSIDEKEGEIDQLRDLLSEYKAAKKAVAVDAEQSAHADLVRLAAVERLPEDMQTKKALDQSVAKLSTQCDQALSTARLSLKDRGNINDFDFATANEVKIYLDVCSGLPITEKMEEIPRSLRDAQFAWDSALKAQFEKLTRALKNGITKAQLYGKESGDTAESIADQLRRSLMTIEHVEKQHPAVFKVFGTFHKSATPLQYYINEQLKGLHTDIQTNLIKSRANFQQYLAQIDLAQALSAACDSRFELFDPKPLPTVRGNHGSFSDLFIDNCAKAQEEMSGARQIDIIKELFPDNGYQDDSLIFHKLQDYHCAAKTDRGGDGPQATYRKLMRYYEVSLESQMSALRTNLFQLERVVDRETTEFFPKLEHFLNRMTGGFGGVLVMFQPLWEDDAKGKSKKTMGDRIEEWIKGMRAMLAEKMYQWLQNINALARSKDFLTAHKRYAAVHNAMLVLQKTATELEVELPNGDKIQIKKLQAETKDEISRQLEKAVAKYNDMPLSDYSMYPPSDLIDRLEQARDANDGVNSVLERLEETIRDKFRDSIKQAKDECNPESTQLVDADRALKSLPKRMHDYLAPMVSDARQYINKESADATKYAKDVLVNVRSGVDVESIRRWCKDSHGKPQHNAARKLVQGELFSRARRCSDDVVVKLDEHNPEAILGPMNALFSWKVLDEYIGADLGDIRTRVADVLSEATATWLAQLQTLLQGYKLALVRGTQASTGRRPSFHTIVRALAVVLDNRKAQAGEVGPEPTPQLESQIQQFEEAFIDLAHTMKRVFQEALNKCDFEGIQNVVDIIALLNTEHTTRNGSVQFSHTMAMFGRTRASQSQNFKGAVDELQLGHVTHDLKLWVDDHATVLRDATLLNKDTRGRASTNKTRCTYFRKLNSSAYVMQDVVPQLMALNQAERTKLVADGRAAVGQLKEKVIDLYRQATLRADRGNNPSVEQLFELGEWMDVIGEIGISVKAVEGITRGSDGPMIDRLQELLKQGINFKLSRGLACMQATPPQFEEAAEMLVQAKMVGEGVKSLMREVSAAIDERLRLVRADKARGSDNIETLHRILETRGDPIGALIVEKHQAFRGGQILRFNERCQKIDYLLEHLTASTKEVQNAPIDKGRLKDVHDALMAEWEEVVKKGLIPDKSVDVRCANALKTIQKLRKQIGPLSVQGQTKQLEWQRPTIDRIPSLLANFFALWTLSTAEHYFDAQEGSDRKKYLMAPHPGQVVALLRMFGIGYKDKPTGVLLNNLVQLKTGEGKSVTMAMAAMVLAVLGCQVSCACYSSTLSERDREAFASLFQLVNVDERIVYGTFDRLCEAVINKDGEVREMAQELIQGASPAKKAGAFGGGLKAGPKRSDSLVPVLIVDEVDVFFSQSYYGQVYVPAAVIRHQTVNTLVLSIWKLREKKPTVKDIKATTEYKECVAHFGQWSQLIVEAVGDMLVDVNRFDSAPYVVKKNMIGYKDQDGLVFNKHHRYCTMFAYCYEAEVTKKITEQSRDQHIGITVRCGNFSYAEIPSYFSCIMGVTGTLDSLSEQPRKIVHSKPFSIEHQTYVPTVFGGSPPIFRPSSEASRDLFITDRAHFDVALQEQITNRRFKDGDETLPRAVLVFFETEEKLRAALSSPNMKSLRENIDVLTEDLDDDEKAERIKRASYAHSITFCTAIFGRGTDFICRDSRVLSNGGVHVIQTYVARSLSDEVQVNGRTARQGQPGSYSMLLIGEELEQFGIDNAKLHATPFEPREGTVQVLTDTYSRQVASGALGQKFQYISECRNRTFDVKYAEETSHIDELKDENTQAFKFVEHLRKRDAKYVREFLEARNVGAGSDVKSRTICLMDATGSMWNLLQKAKNTVSIVYSRLFDLLTEHGYPAGVFEVQFVCYRNYNAPREEILQASPFASRPDDLTSFMTGISANYGIGREAVEAGLWHVNHEVQQGDVSQVLLIGDAPANQPAEVTANRSRRGESYWKSDSRFAKPTTADVELSAIAKAKVPVHAYWVSGKNGWEKSFFEHVAKSTGGQSGFLDVNSEEGKVELTDLLSKKILETLDKTGKMVEAYNKKYGHTVRT
eukprot:m.311601 g.311601  ORF g.311601 m.311601 type:complete len:3639 (+) comp16386_c0_seq3:125-11041(+)